MDNIDYKKVAAASEAAVGAAARPLLKTRLAHFGLSAKAQDEVIGRELLRLLPSHPYLGPMLAPQIHILSDEEELERKKKEAREELKARAVAKSEELGMACVIIIEDVNDADKRSFVATHGDKHLINFSDDTGVGLVVKDTKAITQKNFIGRVDALTVSKA